MVTFPPMTGDPTFAARFDQLAEDLADRPALTFLDESLSFADLKLLTGHGCGSNGLRLGAAKQPPPLQSRNELYDARNSQQGARGEGRSR